MLDRESIKATADAVAEVAKMGAEAVQGAREGATWVARVIQAPVEVAVGIWTDKLKYTRAERQLRLYQQYEALLETAGLRDPTRSVPLSFAVPLLQEATLEEDDSLQDLWAALLVNAANASSGVETRRAFIDVLKNLTAFEATLLQTLYAAAQGTFDAGVLSSALPQLVQATTWQERIHLDLPPEPSDEMKLALANLARLGCVSLGTSWDDSQIFGAVKHTLFGAKLVAACTVTSAAF